MFHLVFSDFKNLKVLKSTTRLARSSILKKGEITSDLRVTH